MVCWLQRIVRKQLLLVLLGGEQLLDVLRLLLLLLAELLQRGVLIKLRRAAAFG